MFKKLIVLSTIMAISTTAFSSSRVEETINLSTQERLEKIVEQENDLVKSKKELSTLSTELASAKAGNGKHEMYLKQEGVAALITLVSMGALYKMVKVGNVRCEKALLTNTFSSPSAAENVITVLGMIGVAAGGFKTVEGGIALYLTRDEVNKLQNEVRALGLEIDRKKSELSSEVKQLCKIDPRHELCY